MFYKVVITVEFMTMILTVMLACECNNATETCTFRVISDRVGV